MSNKFHEMSFYFNQDVGEAASVSDENECDDDADNLETNHLKKPPDESSSAHGGSNRSSTSTPKCADRFPSAHRTNDSPRDCLPGKSRQRSETADSKKPTCSLACEGTDCLLAASDSNNDVLADDACSSALPLHDKWNSGDASLDLLTTNGVEADNVRRKGMLTNGHIPYNFVTTARC